MLGCITIQLVHNLAHDPVQTAAVPPVPALARLLRALARILAVFGVHRVYKCNI